MPNKNLRAGIIAVKIDGFQYDAKGSFTYNLGRAKRTPIEGADRPHGFSVKPQTPRIEGVITDFGTLDVTQVLDLEDGTVTIELSNGKVIVLEEGYYSGEGDITTEEGEIPFIFHGINCEEIT